MRCFSGYALEIADWGELGGFDTFSSSNAKSQKIVAGPHCCSPDANGPSFPAQLDSLNLHKEPEPAKE